MTLGWVLNGGRRHAGQQEDLISRSRDIDGCFIGGDLVASRSRCVSRAGVIVLEP
jgi:hypothetical protein